MQRRLHPPVVVEGKFAFTGVSLYIVEFAVVSPQSPIRSFFSDIGTPMAFVFTVVPLKEVTINLYSTTGSC